MAREVFLLLRLQDPYRDEELHPQGSGYLLHWMLRGEIRDPLHQMQQGTVVEFSYMLFHPRLYLELDVLI